MQTGAERNFWDRSVTAKISSYDFPAEVEAVSSRQADINFEAALVGETRAIVGELKNMKSIKATQQSVLKDFVKHSEETFLPRADIVELRGDMVPSPSTSKNVLKGQDSDAAQYTIKIAQKVKAGLEEQDSDLQNLIESAEHAQAAVSLWMNYVKYLG